MEVFGGRPPEPPWRNHLHTQSSYSPVNKGDLVGRNFKKSVKLRYREYSHTFKADQPWQELPWYACQKIVAKNPWRVREKTKTQKGMRKLFTSGQHNPAHAAVSQYSVIFF